MKMASETSIASLLVYYATIVGATAANQHLSWYDGEKEYEGGFYDLAVNRRDCLVDKSLLIEEVLARSNENNAILITQPRGYGKTTNMDMIRRFLEVEVDRNGQRLPKERCINRKLFLGGEVALKRKNDDTTKTAHLLKPLKIAQATDGNVTRHLGNHPVISIDFDEFAPESYEQAESEIERKIGQLLGGKFGYLKARGNDSELFNFDTEKTERVIRLGRSLASLSKLLFEHFRQKVFILIDDYDTPLMNAYLLFGQHREFIDAINLFGDLLRNGLYRNEYLKAALITGVSPILRSNLGPRNVVQYTWLRDEAFCSHYGFFDAEVESLIGQRNVSVAQLKKWTYNHRAHGRNVYAPWLVERYLEDEGRLKPYWNRSNEKRYIAAALAMDGVQRDLQKLLLDRGEDRIEFYLTDDVNLFYTNDRELILNVAAHSGYLVSKTAQEIDRDQFDYLPYSVSFANEEARLLCGQSVLRWVCHAMNARTSTLQQLAELLSASKTSRFARQLQTLTANVSLSFEKSQLYATSHRSIDANLFYRGLAFSLIFALRSVYAPVNRHNYDVYPGREIVLLPREAVNSDSRAIVFKYNVANNDGPTVNAIEQLRAIDVDRYAKKVQRIAGVTKILVISLIFGKNVVYADCRLDAI